MYRRSVEPGEYLPGSSTAHRSCSSMQHVFDSISGNASLAPAGFQQCSSRCGGLTPSYFEPSHLSHSDIATEHAEDSFLASWPVDCRTTPLPAMLELVDVCPSQQAAPQTAAVLQNAASHPSSSSSWLDLYCPDNCIQMLAPASAAAAYMAAAAGGVRPSNSHCQPGLFCCPEPSCDLSSEVTAAISVMAAPAAATVGAAAGAELTASADLSSIAVVSCDTRSESAATPAAAAAAAAAAARRPAVMRVDKRKEANRQNQRRMRQKRQEEADKASQELAAAAHQSAELQQRLTALRTDQHQLLGRLSDVTGKWRATVAQNQQLHQQNSNLQLQLSEVQQQLALLQHECQQYRQLMQRQQQ